MPPDLGDKYLQVLKHGQGIEEQATLEVLCDRLVGSVYPIELMMEMGRWFEPSEIKVVTVLELLDMNPYAAMGKRFRCKVMNDGL